jgi:chromosome segregation ATPase
MQEQDKNIVLNTPKVPANQMGNALRELEAHYVNNAQVYAEELGRYTLEIKKLTSQIEALIPQEQKNITLLRPIEDEIYYQQRQLEKLNEVFAQHILHLEALDNHHEKHKKELFHLLDEIEEHETTVLEKELQRLNLLSILEPIQRQISQLRTQRKECMLKKEQYETTKISQIAMFRTLSEDEKEVVDIDIIEGDIDKNMSI